MFNPPSYRLRPVFVAYIHPLPHSGGKASDGSDCSKNILCSIRPRRECGGMFTYYEGSEESGDRGCIELLC